MESHGHPTEGEAGTAKRSVFDRARSYVKRLTEMSYEDVQSSISSEMKKREDASGLMDYAHEVLREHGENASPAVNRVMEKAFHAAKDNPLMQAQIASEMMENGKYAIARTAYQELLFNDKENLEAKQGYADAIVKSTEQLLKEPRNAELRDSFVDDVKKAEHIYDELIAAAGEEDAGELKASKREAEGLRQSIEQKQ